MQKKLNNFLVSLVSDADSDVAVVADADADAVVDAGFQD